MTEDRIMAELVHRGVTIHCPQSVYIAPDVDPSRISRDSVVLHPGTQIRGADTLIGPGCVLGEEGPVTLDNAALGKRVHVKGGFVARSALLDDVTIGLGAQVREGCVMEEQTTLGHNVGIKQTILMPYVTLGSQINFCDAMMGGGTSRRDHSEVGSGFVHFNFTPIGTKATASMFGDVPRGVFLRQKRIFLGGMVGAVGPLKVGYGSVVGAGSMLRSDIGDDEFVLSSAHDEVRRAVTPSGQMKPAKVAAIIDHNLNYLAQLRTLLMWYTSVRWVFCGRFRLGGLLNQQVQGILVSTAEERVKRLRDLAIVIDDAENRRPSKLPLRERVDAAIEALMQAELPLDEGVIEDITEPSLKRDAGYLDTMAGLDDAVVAAGQAWLQSAVDACMTAASQALGDLVASDPGLRH